MLAHRPRLGQRSSRFPAGGADVASGVAAGRPAIFYAHPWEFDPDQPRMPLPLLEGFKRFRHYNNLGSSLARLDRLLGDFDWGPMGSFAEASAHALDPDLAASA